MNLKTIEQLLQNAQIILQKDKAEKKEHEARGEYFNVFEILHFTAHPTNPVECCADANPKTMLPNDT